MGTNTKPKPVIPGLGHLHLGSVTETDRRTLIDDRTGIVIDISQSGPDERPMVTIELYPWHRGFTVQIDHVGGYHPALALTRVPTGADTNGHE